ncbi:MAG: hypothetical protein ACREFW_01875, partial [Rhizomicrobium sp.]
SAAAALVAQVVSSQAPPAAGQAFGSSVVANGGNRQLANTGQQAPTILAGLAAGPPPVGAAAGTGAAPRAGQGINGGAVATIALTNLTAPAATTVISTTLACTTPSCN